MTYNELLIGCAIFFITASLIIYKYNKTKVSTYSSYIGLIELAKIIESAEFDSSVLNEFEENIVRLVNANFNSFWLSLILTIMYFMYIRIDDILFILAPITTITTTAYYYRLSLLRLKQFKKNRKVI